MIVLIFALLAQALAAPAGPNPQTSTLKGVRSVSISVDPIAPAAARLGVTEDALRDQVMQALKSASISVSSDKGVELTVTVNAVPIETTRRSTNGIAYTVAVSIDQDARLTRTGESARTTTWRRAGIGVARTAQAKDAIRDQLREYLNAFVAAWRTANSKPPDRAPPL